jgi:hypothetical protein
MEMGSSVFVRRKPQRDDTAIDGKCVDTAIDDKSVE